MLYIHGRGWFDTTQNSSDVPEQMKEVPDALELRRRISYFSSGECQHQLL